MSVQIPLLKSFKTRPCVLCDSVPLCYSELDLKIEIPKTELPAVLSEIYPSLSLIEVFNWITYLQTHHLEIRPADISQAYGFFWNDLTETLFQQSHIWPPTFKEWAHTKKAHGNDLRVLSLMKKLTPQEQLIFLNLLKAVPRLNPSLSEGKKIMELFLDLLGGEQQKSLQNLGDQLVVTKTAPLLTTDQVIKRLTKMRYPLTTQIDLKKKNFIEKSKWPSGIKVRFSRQGDKSGFELISFVSNKDQCEKINKTTEDVLKNLETFFKNESLSQSPNTESQPSNVSSSSHKNLPSNEETHL